MSITLVAAVSIAACASTTRKDNSPSTSASATSPKVGLPTFFSECDATDEVDGGDIAIEKAVLHNDGTLLFATVTLSDPVQPTDANVAVTFNAFSANGETGYHFGSKFLDGAEIANYVFDTESAKQENLPNGVVFVDGQIASRYPVALVEGLGDSFGWYVTVSVDGEDVASCGTSDSKIIVAA